jgi:hypothetical protein
VTLSVSLPPGTSCGRATLAAGFEALYEANHARLPCTFAIERRDCQTRFLVTCPPELRAFLEAQIYAAAPAARIDAAEEEETDSALTTCANFCLRSPPGVRESDVTGREGDRLRMLLAVFDRLPPTGSAAPFLLTVDEFGSFATDAFSSILFFYPLLLSSPKAASTGWG